MSFIGKYPDEIEARRVVEDIKLALEAKFQIGERVRLSTRGGISNGLYYRVVGYRIRPDSYAAKRGGPWIEYLCRREDGREDWWSEGILVKSEQ